MDAVFDRLRGRGRPISLFEGVVGAAAAPVALGLLLVAKFDPRGGMEGLPANGSGRGGTVAPDSAIQKGSPLGSAGG